MGLRMSALNLEVKDIALAAYMKMEGCKVDAFDGASFRMTETGDKSVEDWSLEYTNSCCCTHDNQLLQLRNMVRRHNKHY
jgi:hypothetical protein